MPTRVALCALLVACCWRGAGGITHSGHVTQVVGVAGRSVDLPCDVTTTKLGDQVLLVLWYKNKRGKPTYSFDVRGDRSFTDRVWDAGGSARATFVAAASPPALRLAAVRPDDQATYRCRVDFTRSPTRNQRVSLTVVIPPARPVIVYKKRPVSGLLGPLQEGDTVDIACFTRGGRPTPRVEWLREGRVLTGEVSRAATGRVTSRLRLPPLQRTDLHTRLVCSAFNNLSEPLVAEVVIDMNFRPLGVEILGSSRTSMLVGRSYEVVCRAYGSRPAANVSWWIEQRHLGGNQAESGQGNITTSTLSFTPRAADNGKNLTCRADNNFVVGGTTEDVRPLNVRYAPLVSVRLGYALDLNDIKEGADVYFDCVIHANPAVYSVVWCLNDKPLSPSVLSGVGDMVSINDRSLIVRNLTRRSSGAYLCKASNPEGEGVSRSIDLKVKYSPVCVSGQKVRYGTARNEAARVSCRVDAYPADVTFKWQFNSSTETLDLPFSQITPAGLESVATFTPKTELDYGALLCKADNSMGRMLSPCVFNIVPAGPPEPLGNCTLLNQTSKSLEVQCAAGFDGGLPQFFVAELYDVAGRRLVRNVTRPFAHFSVTELPAGLELRLELYSANGRGRSRPVTLDGFTLKAAEKRISSTSGPQPEDHGLTVTPILGVLIGVVASLIIIAIGVVACMRGNSRKIGKPAQQADLVSSSLLTKQRSPTGCGRGPAQTAGKALYDAEHNPDVVANTGDPGYELVPAARLLNHLNVSRSRTSSPVPTPPSGTPLKNNISHQDDGIVFCELTLPRSGQVGKVARAAHEPVPTFATFSPGRPSRDPVVRTVVLRDQESVV